MNQLELVCVAGAWEIWSANNNGPWGKRMRAVLFSRVHCLFTIFTLPIMHIVYHPHPPFESIVFKFFWDGYNTQEELKNMVMQNMELHKVYNEQCGNGECGLLYFWCACQFSIILACDNIWFWVIYPNKIPWISRLSSDRSNRVNRLNNLPQPVAT